MQRRMRRGNFIAGGRGAEWNMKLTIMPLQRSGFELCEEDEYGIGESE